MVRWTGEAPAIAQVDKFTPANVEVGDIFTLTITDGDGTSHVVNFVATVATVENVTAGLSAAWTAAGHALTTPITAADDGPGNFVTLTANVAGNAFSVVSTATNGGAADTQTLIRAAVTANSGPKDWSVAANWDIGGVPGGAPAQNVFVENWTGDIIYGLDQSGAAQTISSLNFGQSFTGRLGVNGAAGHSGTYLQTKATLLDIGYHYASGTPIGANRIMIDLGATASTVTIHNSSTTTDADKPAIRLLADSDAIDIEIRKGKVGIGFEAGETTEIRDINASFVNNVAADVELFVGIGVTMGDLVKTGGECSLGCAATEVTNSGGNMLTHGSGAIDTLIANRGIVTSNSDGLVGVALAQGTGVIDFSKSSAGRTVTTPQLGSGGKIIHDPDVMDFTNEIAPVSGGSIAFSAA